MTDGGWKEAVGLPESTDSVTIYCDIDDKEQWTREAEEQDYKSRSVYLYELIQEARRYREAGFLSWHHSQERIEKLEETVERLQDELEQEKSDNNPASRFGTSEIVTRHLSRRYQSLAEIVQSVVEEEELDDALRKPVEETLYALAAGGDVEYRRGHGWRLAEGGE